MSHLKQYVGINLIQLREIFQNVPKVGNGLFVFFF